MAVADTLPAVHRTAPAAPAAPLPEQPLRLHCQGETLVGVLAPAAGTVGVVVVVGGPQVRTGSHRQFTLLARHLAAQGFPVLRFDVRGMGDSTGALHDFLAIDDDIACAVDTLCQQQPQVRRVVLWGLCDGASASLLYLHTRRDPRVAGLVLLNPWVRSAATLARTQVKHYYGQRLRDPAFWRKLLSGGVALGALTGWWRNLRAARQPAAAAPQSFQQRMAAAWQAFAGEILLVLSGRDYTAREFQEAVASDPAWAGALQRPGVTVHTAAEADHTFSRITDRQALELVTSGWLARLA